MTREDFEKTLSMIESALAHHMRYGDIPRRRIFAQSNAAGFTDREIALSEKWYCDGAKMVLREMEMVVAQMKRDEDS